MADIQMKDSGVEWIGEIPKHWKVKRVKNVLKYLKKKTLSGRNDVLSLTLKGVIEKDIASNKGLNPESYDTYQEFEKDDLVFKLIDLANYQTSRVGIVWKSGIMSSAYIRLRKKKKEDNIAYLYHQFFDLYNRRVFNHIGSNGVRSTLGKDELLNMPFLNISTSEQTAIANYLDHHTAKIDGEVDYLEKKATLLEEFKQSLIFETVTKGLNKSVPMKDSGIEWIGEIPEHWKVKRFKDVFDAEKGSAFPENSTEGIYPYINGGMKPSGFSNCKNSKSNTIVVSEGGASAGYSQIMEQDFWAGSHCYKIGVGRNSTKYTFYLLKGIEKHLMLLKTGSAMPNLQKTRFLNFVIPYSSIFSEQKQIADYLDKECGIIDTKVNQYRKKAKLLKEYKQSLIYEAVTGKIEIPKEFF